MLISRPKKRRLLCSSPFHEVNSRRLWAKSRMWSADTPKSLRQSFQLRSNSTHCSAGATNPATTTATVSSGDPLPSKYAMKLVKGQPLRLRPERPEYRLRYALLSLSGSKICPASFLGCRDTSKPRRFFQHHKISWYKYT